MARDLQTCARKVAIKSLTAWNGWKADAPEEKRLAYRLGKLTGFPAAAGKIVHSNIARLITKRIRPGEADARYIADGAVQELRDAWTTSIANYWKESPKKTRFFEHHYDIKISDSYAATVARNMRDCLDFWIRARSAAFFEKDFVVAACENLEEMEIEIDRTPLSIWVVLDLMSIDPESGRVNIWDWKTGKERDADRVQSTIYVFYATRKGNIPATAVNVHLDYLSAGKQESYRASLDDIGTATQAIRETLKNPAFDRIKKMVDGEIPEDLSAFPILSPDNRRGGRKSPCIYCNYFEFCHGSTDIGR